MNPTLNGVKIHERELKVPIGFLLAFVLILACWMPTAAQAGLDETLFVESREGNVSKVQALLEQGADVHYSPTHGLTALWAAAKHGHLEVVEILLRHGAEVNAVLEDGVSPLFSAIENGHVKIVQLLLAHNADASLFRKGGMGPMFTAAHKGYVKIIEALIQEREGQVLPSLEDKSVSLWIGASEGYEKVVKILIENGANLDFQLPQVG